MRDQRQSVLPSCAKRSHVRADIEDIADDPFDQSLGQVVPNCGCARFSKTCSTGIELAQDELGIDSHSM